MLNFTIKRAHSCGSIKFNRFLPALLLIGMISCKSSTEEREGKDFFAEDKVEVQGHRGDRGNFPENTVAAFKSAVKKGVDVLELDVVISKDKKVVVSHEPFMSSIYMLTPRGDSIAKADERNLNLYEMSYDSIRKFDAGSRKNRHFPQQQNFRTYKPLLAEAIDSVESFIAEESLRPVKYNIELKSVEAEYGIFQPAPEEFVNLVMEVLKEKGIQDRVNIQSFDVNILNVIHKSFPEVEIAYLVSGEGIDKNLSLLDFRPEIYSPHYGLVRNETFVDSVKSLQMKLIPWTVNEKEDIQKMLSLNVDGIITDYPERVIEENSTK